MLAAFRPLAVAVACAAACTLATPAAAATATTASATAPIIPMQHTSWTAGDGAPTGINAIAQTPDGWLWIGSATGLFRFDGVRFERAAGAQAALSSNVFNLGVLPDGTLWVSYKYGGVSLMKDGRMRHFRVGEHQMPGGSTASMGQDAAGRIWMSNNLGLRMLGADGNWQQPAPALAAPSGETLDMLLDRSGRFWLRNMDAVYLLPQGGTRFEHQQAATGYGKLAQAPDGSIWTSDLMRPGLHLVSAAAGTNPQAWPVDDRLSVFRFDRAGKLWQPDYSGVARMSPGDAAHPERTDAEHGLSGQHGYAVFEDSEQNIWVGTENGLDRFRDYRLKALELPRYIAGARPLAARASGGVWVDRSFLSAPDAAPQQIGPLASQADLTSALHQSPDGTLWSGGIGGLWKIVGTQRSAVPLPIDMADPMRAPVLSMASDAQGRLWVSFGRRGLYTLRDGAWQPHGAVPGLALFFPPVLAADAQGRMWFGSTDDQLRILEGERVRSFGREDGLEVGTVLSILPTGDGAWIGGENGLAHFDGKQFVMIAGRGGDPFAGITGLVFDRDGTLWVNGGAGISAIAAGQLRQALQQPAHRVQFERLDYRDGLRGTASTITPMPSAIRDRDGLLWFSTMGGVVAFDPARLPRNHQAPPVYITGLKAGNADYVVQNGLRLPPHTTTLALDFTALGYSAPERMRFRYRLEGVDHDWQEADAHRSAHYTNLEPGRYRFRVIASNDGGVWSEQGAALSFEIAPGVMQTLWFRLACGGAALLGLWLLYRMQLRQAARQLAVQMNARLAERERIARELHDTLLQSVYGLILKMSLTLQRLPAAERQPLEEALDRANAVVDEGRDRVAGLRGESAPHAGLASAISDYGTPLAQDNRVRFDVITQGEAMLLDSAVSNEVLAIVREAVWNAFVHAQPRAVTVTLAFTPSQLTVTVSDDGRGMPAEVMQQGGRPGHWGIPGMRERAARLGTLELVSGAAGTTWTLRATRLLQSAK